MATIVVGCDKNGHNDAEYQKNVAKILEDAGHTVEILPVDSNEYARYSYDSSKSKGKLGVFLIAAGTFSIGDATFGKTYFDYNYFGIRPECSPNWDVGDFDTKPIGSDNDARGGVTNKIAGKSFKEINEIVKSRSRVVTGKDATEMGNNLVAAISGSSPNNSSSDEGDDEEEEWDDKDNFTPHKGNIMEIKPYKQISDISFDKSYDSPTGTGTVELLFNSKDYRFLYKGVAMKLKLRRTCDKEWSPTGLEEPDYDENEKFFKEHIPTDELLKELGLPNYRKQGGVQNNTSSTTDSDNSGGEHLSDEYISKILPDTAKKLSSKTNIYDKESIEKLKKRAAETK